MGFKPCLKPHQLKMAINLPYYSIPRTFQVPPGYSILNLNTNNFTDPVINNLYTRFACCFGERINSINQARKKGKICKIDSDTKYLLMALYVLRNWFNPANTLPSVSFTLPLPSTLIWPLFLVSSNGNGNTSFSMGNIFGVAGNPFSIFLLSLQNSLPSNFTATGNENTNTITITCNTPNMNNWLYIQKGGGVNAWYHFTGNTFNPCLTPQQVALIIERCFKICGCQNCNNVKVMEEDNTYIPFGQPNPPSLPLQTYLTSPIYSVKPGEFPCINPYWS